MERFIRKLKNRFHQLQNYVQWDSMSIHERMFHMLAIIGSIVSFICLIETVLVSDSFVLIATLTALFIIVMVSLWTSIFRKKIDFAATIVAVFINYLVFPALFLLQNGLFSGAPLWFLIGYYYIFMLFKGRKFWFLLLSSMGIDIVVYVIALELQEYFGNTMDLHSAYLDSLFSVLAVGIAIGTILRLIMGLYDKEQQISRARSEELEISSKSRNSLFAGMSHEIRTPINTIMGLNELILRSNPTPEVEDYANDIENASTMLLSLVNDILDFSRMEIQQLDIIPLEYNSKSMFMNLYDMIRIHAKKKNLELRFDVDTQFPAFLYGDEKRIKQVVLNLLNNAVKYTERGSISLEATGEKTADGIYQMRLTVIDTGLGIKKEDIPHIYDSFSRFDEKKNSTIEGTGLGLSIVKQLVDLMGGAINVDSIYSRGTTFTVVIPQKIVEHTPVGNIHFGESEEKSRYKYQQKFEAPDVKILIVDDNRVNSVVTSRLLASTRMQIYSAANGKECLEMCHRRFFNVILMDYLMPDMDGSETLRQLRSQENGLCRETPVIALTATSRAEAENLQIGVEFDGYLEKPIRSDLLEEEILKCLPRELVTYRQETLDFDAIDDNPAASVRRKKKVRITTDCVSDLPQSYIEKYDIHVQNLYIHTESGRFLDTIEIDSDNMSQYIRDSVENIHADSCSIAEFESFFAQNLTEAFDVVHISMAANSGRTYSRALSAAQGFDHVHVIDSGHISCGQALLVLEAARLAELGKSVEEILIAIDDAKRRVQSGFLMPFPSLFQKRGYTHSVIPKITKAFHLRPILRMRKSVISVVGFMLGDDNEKLWRKYVNYRLRGERYIDSGVVMVSFAGCSAEKRKVVLKEIQNRYDFNVIVESKSSFSSACNCGEGTFGFAFFEKDSQ